MLLVETCGRTEANASKFEQRKMNWMQTLSWNNVSQPFWEILRSHLVNFLLLLYIFSKHLNDAHLLWSLLCSHFLQLPIFTMRISLISCLSQGELGIYVYDMPGFHGGSSLQFFPYNQHAINWDLAFTINKFTLKRSIHISAVNPIGGVKICGRWCGHSRSCGMQRLNIEGRSIFVWMNLWGKSSPRGLKSAILGQGFYLCWSEFCYPQTRIWSFWRPQICYFPALHLLWHFVW